MPLPKEPPKESKYYKKKREILARYEKESKYHYYRLKGCLWAFREGDDDAKRFYNDIYWIKNLMKFVGGVMWTGRHSLPELRGTINEIRYYFFEDAFFYDLWEDKFFVTRWGDCQFIKEFIEKLKSAILLIRNNFCDSMPLSKGVGRDLHPALKEIKW
jgi:hypothetical protein